MPFLLCGTSLVGCSSPKTTTAQQQASPKPSKDNWAKVKDGMTEKEVEAIMGPGEGASVDLKKFKVPGMPDIPDMPNMPNMPKLSGKSWKEGKTVYTAIFKDDKVVAREDREEKETPASKITAENYAKIKTDMTRKEVEAILGPPTKGSGGKIKDFSGEVAVWEEGNKMISVGFVLDKVVQTAKTGF
jgi:hypothetical protein